MNDTPARRIVILTQGHTNPITAKTASCVIRYRGEEVVALLDDTQSGKTARELLGVGGDLPVVGSLEEVAAANTLLVGIAPPGGKIPPEWRPILHEAARRGMEIVSGLHDYLTADESLVATAAQYGAKLRDLRRTEERDVASGQDFAGPALRIHTVGNDCSVGKMLVSMELAQALQRKGHDARFLATGQTGIMVAGDGCPVDSVVSDFLPGAVEKLVRRYEHHEIVVIEGQGSLAHPRYSPVTLGLLHGCRPQGMILCYEVGREAYHGLEPLPLRPLAELRQAYETVAGLVQPARVIGVAMNSRRVSEDEAAEERERIGKELGLPVCDVIRDGPEPLVAAVERLQAELSR